MSGPNIIQAVALPEDLLAQVTQAYDKLSEDIKTELAANISHIIENSQDLSDFLEFLKHPLITFRNRENPFHTQSSQCRDYFQAIPNEHPAIRFAQHMCKLIDASREIYVKRTKQTEAILLPLSKNPYIGTKNLLIGKQLKTSLLDLFPTLANANLDPNNKVHQQFIGTIERLLDAQIQSGSDPVCEAVTNEQLNWLKTQIEAGGHLDDIITVFSDRTNKMITLFRNVDPTNKLTILKNTFALREITHTEFPNLHQLIKDTLTDELRIEGAHAYFNFKPQAQNGLNLNYDELYVIFLILAAESLISYPVDTVLERYQDLLDKIQQATADIDFSGYHSAITTYQHLKRDFALYDDSIIITFLNSWRALLMETIDEPFQSLFTDDFRSDPMANEHLDTLMALRQQYDHDNVLFQYAHETICNTWQTTFTEHRESIARHDIDNHDVTNHLLSQFDSCFEATQTQLAEALCSNSLETTKTLYQYRNQFELFNLMRFTNTFQNLVMTSLDPKEGDQFAPKHLINFEAWLNTVYHSIWTQLNDPDFYGEQDLENKKNLFIDTLCYPIEYFASLNSQRSPELANHLETYVQIQRTDLHAVITFENQEPPKLFLDHLQANFYLMQTLTTFMAQGRGASEKTNALINFFEKGRIPNSTSAVINLILYSLAVSLVVFIAVAIIGTVLGTMLGVCDISMFNGIWADLWNLVEAPAENFFHLNLLTDISLSCATIARMYTFFTTEAEALNRASVSAVNTVEALFPITPP